MVAPETSTLALIALVPLMIWRVIVRFRRMIGRQRLYWIRPTITLSIYSLLSLALLWNALAAGQAPWMLLGGLALGAVLSRHGLRVTTFEVSRKGVFYTPHTGLGIALSLLFVARILFRIVQIVLTRNSVDTGSSDFFHSPLTLIAFGFLAGYYLGYAVGLLRYRQGVLKAKALRERLGRESEAAVESMKSTATGRPVALIAAAVAPRSKPSNYPAEFALRMAGREKRALGDPFGLNNFGVNLTRLAPGAVSALRHCHATQDEFIYILEGAPTLITDTGELVLRRGMCAGFAAASGDAHQLVNRTDRDVLYLEVGDRLPGDSVDYPDDDLKAVSDDGGKWSFIHKDGTLFP